jgi:hypothetical protein
VPPASRYGNDIAFSAALDRAAIAEADADWEAGARACTPAIGLAFGVLAKTSDDLAAPYADAPDVWDHALREVARRRAGLATIVAMLRAAERRIEAVAGRHALTPLRPH